MKIDTAIIMAGGKGERFGSKKKPFVDLCGKPLMFNMIDNIRNLFNFIIIAVSDNVKDYINLIKQRKDILILYTTGLDYSIDLGLILRIIKRRPIMIFPSDIPFLKENAITKIMKLAENIDKDLITIINNEKKPLGISVVKGDNLDKWDNLEIDEKFVNINTLKDYYKAKEMCND